MLLNIFRHNFEELDIWKSILLLHWHGNISHVHFWAAIVEKNINLQYYQGFQKCSSAFRFCHILMGTNWKCWEQQLKLKVWKAAHSNFVNNLKICALSYMVPSSVIELVSVIVVHLCTTLVSLVWRKIETLVCTQLFKKEKNSRSSEAEVLTIINPKRHKPKTVHRGIRGGGRGEGVDHSESSPPLPIPFIQLTWNLEHLMSLAGFHGKHSYINDV